MKPTPTQVWRVVEPIDTLQRPLGHGHIATTLRYLHLARSRITGTPSPLDLLDP